MECICLFLRYNTPNDKYILNLFKNSLFEFFLSSYHSEYLTTIAQRLNLFDIDFPNQLTHIIGYLLVNYPNDLRTSLKLLSKLDEEKTINIHPIIEREYKKIKAKDKPDYENLILFLKYAPFVAKNDKKYYINSLKSSIIEYKSPQGKKSSLLFYIIELFNFLAPKRGKYQLHYLPKSNEIDFRKSIVFPKELDNQYLLFHAPDQFYQNSTKFWIDIYEKNIELLSDLVQNDFIFEHLTFLHDYYELVPYNIRYSHFIRQKEFLKINGRSINIYVSRSNILSDTFNKLSNTPPKHLLFKTKIHFMGEKGIDEGGLTSEWLSIVIQEIFNPDFGLFIKNEKNCYHPNPSSYSNPNHIQYFKMAGEIIALAVLNGQSVNAHLSMALYRQILHQKIKIKDLEDFDESLYKSMQMILDIDDVSVLDLYFSIDDSYLGETKTIDLIENGRNINVTNENRLEYVSKYANYKLRKSVIEQITAFCKGFDEIIPQKYIRIFSPSELDLLICGIPHIDLDDMRRYTHYGDPFYDQHPTIIMFFNVLSKWSQEDLAKFLFFLSGSSQVPINGFKYFEDCKRPITIVLQSDKKLLPVAHTCYRILDLPMYDSEKEMNQKLMIAINEYTFDII